MESPPKQARFIQEYLIDLNGTQAAIYSEKSKETVKNSKRHKLA